MRFLLAESADPKGFRDLFVLVFLHVESRRVFLTPATYHPNEAWVCEQAKAFVRHAKKAKLPIDIVMHDRDSKFSKAFDDQLRKESLRVQKAAYRSPNTVAYVERFVQTIQQEVLDHFIVFGERHLNHLCAVFVDYYHRLRPHQGKDNELLVAERRRRSKPPPTEVIPLSEVRCAQQLGGLLKHYYRKAA